MRLYPCQEDFLTSKLASTDVSVSQLIRPTLTKCLGGLVVSILDTSLALSLPQSVLQALETYNRAREALRKRPKWKSYRIKLEESSSFSGRIGSCSYVPIGGSETHLEGRTTRESAIWFTCQIRDKDSLTPKQREAINAGSVLDARSLYALAPWSWLADWFIPVSANLDNINMSNYVHIKMCAVMNQVSYKAHAKSVVSYIVDDGYEDKTVSSSHDVVMKRRVPFVPFGISVTIPKLTLYRASILGALAATFSKR